MYKRILVPCDGSDLAQASVFPHVAALGREPDTQVVILRVIPAPMGRSATAYRARTPGVPVALPENEHDAHVAHHPIYKDQEIASAEDEAKRSVAGAAAVLREQGVNVATEVVIGDPAETIVDYAAEKDVDLIVMCSHGRGGLTRWVFGSVTEKVLRGTTLPLLVIRPEALRKKVAGDQAGE
jgi:nucleotide-binding universal stress UspA family protein